MNTNSKVKFLFGYRCAAFALSAFVAIFGSSMDVRTNAIMLLIMSAIFLLFVHPDKETTSTHLGTVLAYKLFSLIALISGASLLYSGTTNCPLNILAFFYLIFGLVTLAC